MIFRNNMKTMRMINLDFELNERLKLEENVSGLISSLLEDYFLMKGRETPAQILEAINLINKRTDISLDEKNRLITPFQEKKKELDEEIQRKIEETARKHEEQILREKALFERKEKIIKFCWCCEKNFNLNNLKMMWGADICIDCSVNPELKNILIVKSDARNEARKNQKA